MPDSHLLSELEFCGSYFFTALLPVPQRKTLPRTVLGINTVYFCPAVGPTAARFAATLTERRWWMHQGQVLAEQRNGFYD